MILGLKARVKETSTTAGTGTLSLAGAVTGFRTFLSAFGSGNSCYYTIVDGNAWEMGIGVVTSGAPNTLTRATILDSSSGGILTLSGGTKVVFCEAPPDVYLPELEDRTFRSKMNLGGGFLMINNKAYFVYLGKMTRALSIAFVEFQLNTAGAGAQTAEVGLFSTPLPPNKSGQTLTKIVATGTVDTLTSGTGTLKRNTASFAQAIPLGTFLWAGMRTAMATTQPNIIGLAGDQGQGQMLSLAAAGALTALSTFAGAIITLDTANTGPALNAVMD